MGYSDNTQLHTNTYRSPQEECVIRIISSCSFTFIATFPCPNSERYESYKAKKAILERHDSGMSVADNAKGFTRHYPKPG